MAFKGHRLANSSLCPTRGAAVKPWAKTLGWGFSDISDNRARSGRAITGEPTRPAAYIQGNEEADIL